MQNLLTKRFYRVRWSFMVVLLLKKSIYWIFYPWTSHNFHKQLSLKLRLDFEASQYLLYLYLYLIFRLYMYILNLFCINGSYRNMNSCLNLHIEENWKLLHKYFLLRSCQVNIYSRNNIVTIFPNLSKVGIPAEFNSFQRQIPITLMEATFDYPYFKDENAGFEIISLPYEHDGR